jgi:AcrR family transcriptional regulator
MEELILDKAKDLFFSYGLKSVSMDDIAKNAGVSKKTIYKDFEDKTALIRRLVADLLTCHREEVEKCAGVATDAIHEVILYSRTPFQTIALINQAFFYELEKFFPGVWKEVTGYRQQVLIPSILANIKKGITEELYRADLDLVFVAEVRVQQILTALNPKTFTGRKIQRSNLMMQLSNLYLQGIATPKGKKIINKYLNVNNEQQFSN